MVILIYKVVEEKMKETRQENMSPPTGNYETDNYSCYLTPDVLMTRCLTIHSQFIGIVMQMLIIVSFEL